MKEMLLIDGNSMLFRAYYATNYTMKMETSNHIPTNAVYAFNNMLNKVINLVKPYYVVVAFDKGKHTFRHDIYPDYKGGRKETPNDLIIQFDLTRDLLKAYNIPFFELKDIEADDIIGTLSKKFNNTKVNILSSDKDLLQLIDETTNCIMMKKGISDIEVLDTEKLQETMFVRPDQIIDLKGLMGDSSDNIIGVLGVGNKTAIKLLEKYDKLENIYNNIDQEKGKLKENLITYHNQAIMSKAIATIKTDVDIEVNLEDLKFTPNFKSLQEFYQQYEMKSLINNMKKNTFDYMNSSNNQELKDINIKPDNIVFNVIDNLDNINLNKQITLYFDGDYQDYFEPNIKGIAFINDEKFYYLNNLKQIDELLSVESIIVYDIKQIYHILDKFNLSINAKIFDTKIIAFLYDANINDYNTCLNKLNLSSNLDFKNIFTKKNQYDPENEIRINYSIETVKIIKEIFDKTFSYLKTYDMESLYYEMELPLSKVLYEMENNGINCNYEILDEIANKTKIIMNELTKEIYQETGYEFNLNSPKQLAEILYDKLNLSSSNKKSTAQDQLEKIINKHPAVLLILQYRKASKLYSTYAEGLKKFIKDDGKIHTIYHQCLASTGRLSSSDPNMQNIGVREAENKEIRKAFIADENHCFVSCDYSQVELRILADFAKEETMINSFNNNIDIHTQTATKLFNLPITEITAQQRRDAKTVNFGIVYGISEFGLAKQINVSFKQAKQFIENYNLHFPKIKAYQEKQIAFLRENGYVKTLYNRRRIINEINNPNKRIQEFAERAAVNTPIQGSAADIIKMAMVNITKRMKELSLKSEMIEQVHDELIFDVLNTEFDVMKKIIQEEMENVVDLSVKLKSDLSFGKSWFEVK